MSLIFSSSSPPVGSEAGRWGLGSVGVIVMVRRETTLVSLLGFISKVEVTVAKVFSP